MRIASRIALLLPLLATVACNFPMPTADDTPGDDTSGDDDGPKPGADTAYQLRAAEPAIATTGQTLRLEGTFGTSATVHFPGGATQAATILGPHRATVTVPEGATAGDLTVETAGATLGPLPFRRTTFALALQPFESLWAQNNGQRSRTQLAVPRAGHTAVAIGNYIYAVGGTRFGAYLASVERALINADGSLGPFNVVQDVTLTGPRAGHTAVVIGTWLYVLGGTNDTGILNSVERATISADGSLGTFASVDTSLTGARSAATVEVIGTWLYLIGGDGVTGSVERAPIKLDGALGSFEAVVDTKLKIARAGHTSAVVGNSLFVIGGNVNGNLFGSVEQASINPDGSLGDFTMVEGVSLATARFGHMTAIVGDYLYVLAGTGRTGALGTTERTQITGGTLGSFSTVAAITPLAATGSASVITNNYFYQLGGVTSGVETASTRRTSINGGGSFGTFIAIPGVPFSVSRERFALLTFGPYVYAIGGDIGMTVERARVRVDGSLESFMTTTTKLREQRRDFSIAVAGKYLYVIGGAGSTTVERAEISDTGELGEFDLVSGVTLPSIGSQRTCAVVGDAVYVWGGAVDNSGSYVSGVARAQISSDGSLSTFANTSGTLPMAGADIIGVVVGNFVYAIGGNRYNSANGVTTAFTAVRRASIGGGGSVGEFALLSSATTVERSASAPIAVGSSLYLTGGIGSGGVFGAAQLSGSEKTTLQADGSLAPFAAVVGGSLVNVGGKVEGIVLKNTLYVAGETFSFANALQKTTLQ